MVFIHHSKLTIQNSFPLFPPQPPISPQQNDHNHLTQKANS